MGRKTKIALIINRCFSEREHGMSGKTPIMTCNYCSKTYTKNVTRMCSHLLSCKSCPQEIKAKIQEDTKSTLVKKDMRYSCNATSTYSEQVPCLSSSSDNIIETKYTVTQNFTDSTSSADLNASSFTAESSSGWSNTHQSTLKCSFDSIEQTEDDEIWALISRACYASGQPLNFLANKYWKELFLKLRPSLQLPSSHNLSNELLDREYARLFAMVIEKVQQASTIGIQIYEWTNIRNESMVNIILTTPQPVLYKIIDATDNRHCPSFIADVIANIFRDVGLHRTLSIVTNNGRNMTAVWNLLKTQHQDGIFECYDCAAHILNLLIVDIMELNSFKECEKKCVAIIQNIKDSHILSATLKMFQKDPLTGVKSLKFLTRRSSIVMTLESTLSNKIPLQNLAISEHVQGIIDKSVKAHLLQEEFWSQVNEIHKLLLPIFLAIGQLEANTSHISIVAEIFHEIQNFFQGVTKLDENEKLKILEYVNHRQQIALGPVQLAANLLDPHYIGRYLTPEQYINSLSHISKIGGVLYKDAENTDKGIMYELATYKSKESFFSNDFVWSALLNNDDGKLSPVVWWKSLCGHTKLSKVAIAILDCPATTAATARSFSSYGNPQTKVTNHLSNEREAKLLYIKHNLKLTESQTQYNTQSSSMDDTIFVKSEDNLTDEELDPEND